MKAYLFIALLLTTGIGQHRLDSDVLNDFIKSEIGELQVSANYKCGTLYDLMIHAPGSKVDAVLKQNYILKVMQPPARENSLLSPFGNFILHWDETGTDAVPLTDLSGNGIPDYIDSAAVIFDRVRTTEVNILGYQPPYGSDGLPAIPYHIYFTNMVYYGITRPSYVDIPSIPGTNYESYIEVENDYSGFPTSGLNGLRVTAAHEFHHAIQLGYNVRWDDSYFYEMTSTWMEEVIYPDINDYHNYLDDLFRNVSNTQFDQYNGFYPYANSLYLQMLQANYGSEIVKKIWDHMKSELPIEAITSALRTVSTTWRSSLGEYGLWLYYTGDRTILDQFFTDARDFPQVRIKAVDKLVFDEQFNENIITVLTANRYLMFSDLKSNGYNLRVESSRAEQGGFRHLTPTNFSPFYPLNTLISNQMIDTDHMVIILTNAGNQNEDYTLNMTLSGKVDLTTIYAYPNPVNMREAKTLKFQNVPPDADLFIFNMIGERVAMVEGSGESTSRSWTLANERGDKIVSGVYMYLVQNEGTTNTGKFSVIR